MSSLAHSYERIGVRQNAPVSAIYDAYNHWRNYIRPLLEVEASYTYSRKDREDRHRLIVDTDDDYQVLLCTRQRSSSRTRRRRAH